MTVNNNITPFPFYTDRDEQNGRKWWSYGQQYPFFVPMTTLMPFQFARTTRSNGISYVRLYRVDGTLIATITSQMLAAGLHITRFQSAGYDVVSFPAIVPVNLFQSTHPHGVRQYIFQSADFLTYTLIFLRTFHGIKLKSNRLTKKRCNWFIISECDWYTIYVPL